MTPQLIIVTVMEVIIIMTVDEPQGIYYGGTIVAPKVKKIFENILPYLNL